MDQKPQETVTVEFTIGVLDGRFNASATVPAGRTNLTQILPVIQSLDSSFIDGCVEQLAGQGRKVSCKAGCGACCRQMVPISIFEAEALSDWIRSLPEERQRELANRFHQALLKLASKGLIDRLIEEDWFAETDSARQMALDYFGAGVPCPFLENECCSIHPIRPLICREYMVTSPAEFCSAPTANTVEPVRLPLFFSRVLNRIAAEVERSPRGWIPLVFLFAWMESGARPGEAVSGEGPAVLYEFVKRLSEARPPG